MNSTSNDLTRLDEIKNNTLGRLGPGLYGPHYPPGFQDEIHLQLWHGSAS